MIGCKKKTWRHIVDERALTMVELLIAMALTGLIAAGAYSLYFLGIKSWERGMEGKEGLQSVRMALREIEQDLRHAEWVWIGEGWEEAWPVEDCLQPGIGDQIHYGFYGDLYAGEYRPHFTFYTIRLWNNTLYLHKNAVLTELRDIYPIYNAPFPLADNITEINFRYGDETESRILISITSARGDGRTVTLGGNILRRNMLH